MLPHRPVGRDVRRKDASKLNGQRMNGPFLIQLDEANFANIPSKVVPRTIRLKDPSFETLEARECIFIGYCEKLLYKNDRLMGTRSQPAPCALEPVVVNYGSWTCPD